MNGDETDGKSRELRPIPDPTKLTDEAIQRARDQWRDDLKSAMEQIDFRLNRLRIDLDNVQGLHDKSLEHWMRLVDEKFNGVDYRFTDRDARAKDLKIAGDKALEAAFKSAESVNGVMTAQFKAEIEALKAQAAERSKSVDQQLGAITVQMAGGLPVGYGLGQQAQKVERRSQDTLLIGVLGAMFLAISVVFAVYVATHG
jgi:hypothetical protein